MGSRWTGRGSLTLEEPGPGSSRWLPPPWSQGAAPSASALSRAELWWQEPTAATAASLSSLPLRRGIAKFRFLPLHSPEKKKQEMLNTKGRSGQKSGKNSRNLLGVGRWDTLLVDQTTAPVRILSTTVAP